MTDVELYRAGQVTSMADLVRFLRPEKVEVPVSLPPQAVITEEERAALARLPDVFGKVVPTERRDLSEEEITKLHTERQTLDTLEKLIKDRKEAIRTTVLNAMDVRHEAQEVPQDEQPPRDKAGHYVKPSDIPVPDTHVKFAWEVAPGKIEVDLEALKKLSDDLGVGEVTHQDYIDVTTPVRILDEHAFFEKLKAKPELLKHAKNFVSQGAPRGALQIRKQK